MHFEGYTDVALRHEGGSALVYAAKRVSDERPVFIKALKGPYPTAEATRRFRREAEITRRVQGDGVVELIEARVDGASPMMVLEDFGGRSLDLHLDDGPLSPARMLGLALGIVAALARVHDLLVVHKDISPANIVWNRQTGAIKIIDFGIASTVSRERPVLASPAVLKGTLSYIAPEQTGRMNRSVDYRSDYYALGATLYRALAGRPPFEGDDRLALVHAHIARAPADLRALDPELPEDIAAVVARLLSKTADARYQSAYGLRRDLERCQVGLADGGGRRFLLGRYDRPARVRIPGRLYGRTKEIDALSRALARSVDGGREVMLVSGYSGVGKTSVVNEIHRLMVQTGGAFVSGKFDQFRRGQPFASLAEAFGRYFLGAATGSEIEVADLRVGLLEVVGNSGHVLLELIPELELIIGPQPPAPEVPPAEAEARLHRLFRRLISALARPGHPLVLFVDDLQWTDLPTTRLFDVLAQAKDVSHLLIIGAWRDNEIDSTHPLSQTLENIRAGGVTELALAPLSQGDVLDFLADALHTSIEEHDERGELTDLARACRAKTGGNPFFLTRFVLALEERGALRFDAQTGRWSWSLALVEGLESTDNVVALMAASIHQLPERGRAAVCAASILGSALRLALLARLTRSSSDTLLEDLAPALEAGLMLAVGDELDPERLELAFTHDRIQQAALGLLPEAERAALRLRAGRELLAGLDEPEEHELLFDVVQHLNAAGELVVGEERLRLAALNLAAGRRARSSAAWAAALALLERGLALLGPDRPGRDRALACALLQEAATAAYLDQRYDRSDELVDALFADAEDALTRVEALEIRIASHIARHQSSEAIAVGVQALALLGVPLTESPALPEVMAVMGDCGALVAAADLAGLPLADELSAPDRRAAMRLLVALTPPAYVVRPLLMPLLAAAIVRISIEEGLAPDSAYGFALYGLMLCDAGHLDFGYAMGQLSVRLTQRFPAARRIRVRSSHVNNGFVRHWKEPVHDYIGEYGALFDEGLDIGDFEYGCLSALLTGMISLHAGVPLERLEPQMARHTDAMRLLQQDTALSLHGIVHQTALNLMDRHGGDELTLTGEVYDEAAMLAVFEELQHPTGLFVLYCFKTLLAFALGEYGRAAEHAAVAHANAQAGGTATFHLPVFFTLHAVLELWRYDETGDEAALASARASRARVDTWAEANPANLAQKALLLKAEFARSEGRVDEALAAYEAAVAAARERRFLSDEAIANRLTARFFEARGSRTAARAFLLEARYAFQRWGAAAVVRRLDAAHPELVERSRSRGATSGTATREADLDSEAVIRASQAISQEIVLANLVRLLVKLALESSGARTAALLLRRGGRFLLAARGHSAPGLSIEVLEAPAPVRPGDVPASVVNYIARTGREVLENDASREGPFAADPDIQRRGVRSLLALPVAHQGEMNALLYLENDQTAGVFTGERLALARVLLSQAAISIENATLYEELEDKVRERTQQLEQARDEADALLRNVLPEVIAEELKATGSAHPVHVESATVLFTDFRGFTELSESLRPAELVDELEECFTAFDAIMDRHGVEKLKTIGDGYMAVGGVPEANDTHAEDCVLAALEIVAFMARPRGERGLPPFQVRVGLHTGPLVAGVIGRRRFAYDVWGDTVNTASRMESSGDSGRVNISASTYALVADRFRCEHRGKVAAKGKGELDMYFVLGPREPAQ